MALEIELKPEAERILHAEAARRGVSAYDLARGIVEENLPASDAELTSSDEEELLLDELASLGNGLKQAAETYSRETIYADHD